MYSLDMVCMASYHLENIAQLGKEQLELEVALVQLEAVAAEQLEAVAAEQLEAVAAEQLELEVALVQLEAVAAEQLELTEASSSLPPSLHY
jgi:hypothetical protein